MGDKLQSYSGQFSDSARVAVENGFAALSRIYALPGGVSSTLNTLSGGVRYKLDLAAMLDLKAVSGAYDPNNKFCGTQANFDAGIKSQLAGFLSVYNTSITDTNQRADRVVGVVDKNISDGSTSAYNCAEAMASTNSPESWVRAIPDQPAGGGKPAVPSMTGSLMAMEIAHTFGMETGTLSFHSPNTQADGTAPDKAYNLSSRSYLADDRSTMRFVSANPFNNNNALFEKDDYRAHAVQPRRLAHRQLHGCGDGNGNEERGLDDRSGPEDAPHPGSLRLRLGRLLVRGCVFLKRQRGRAARDGRRRR